MFAERMARLLPSERQQQILNVLPRRDFEVLYRLNCDNLCADFKENIDFKFSLGLVSLMNRFFGLRKQKLPLSGHSEGVCTVFFCP